jgi:hypothetical protein
VPRRTTFGPARPIATVGKDGTPPVVPVGWRFNREIDTIDEGGMKDVTVTHE